MPEHTSPHDGLLSATKHARYRKDQHRNLPRQLDRMSRFELVEQCEEHGLPHAGRSDDALRSMLTGA